MASYYQTKWQNEQRAARSVGGWVAVIALIGAVAIAAFTIDHDTLRDGVQHVTGALKISASSGYGSHHRYRHSGSSSSGYGIS